MRPTSLTSSGWSECTPSSKHGVVALLLDVLLHLLLDLDHHFLDAGRVDAAVGDQALE